MRVSIVANASDDETGQAIHQSCRLHLETKDSAKLRAQPVSREPVLHNLVARSYCTIMDDRFFTIPWRPPDYHIFVTLIAVRSPDMAIRGAIHDVWTCGAAMKLPAVG
jgi:hypothetical protein